MSEFNTKRRTEKMETTIVLTVPHAACPMFQTQLHICDWTAEKAARCVSRHLLSQPFQIFANTTVIRSDSIDMNRRKTRNTQVYRKKILKYVQNPKHQVKFVIDVHSFPGHYMPYGRWEVLVLDDFQPRAAYTINFVRSMRAKGIVAGWMPGKFNDIQVEMRTVAKIDSFLVEFNEAIPNRRLETLICPAVAQWLSGLKHKKSTENKNLMYT